MENTEEFFKYCDVKGRLYWEDSVRPCPHPGVIKKYGFRGKVQVCVEVCKKCRYSERDPHFDGYSCTFADCFGKSVKRKV